MMEESESPNALDIDQIVTLASNPSTPLMFKIHERVDARYEIVEKLGEGGMASVWLAKDNAASDMTLALKVLNEQELLRDASRKKMPGQELLNYDRRLRELFLREARATRQLGGHSNIVTVFDFGFSQKENDHAQIIYYMTLEYVEGKNAESLIDERVFETDYHRCVRVALSVCQGLSHAHRRSVLHRDVKPSNILLGKGIIKIGDFGLAKILSETTQAYTVPGGGTALYMAPEQHGANPKTDERTDVYQFGATLFHIFTGLIADHNSLLGWLSEDKKSMHTPGQLNPHVSRNISDIIVRMLSYDPADRPSLQMVHEVLQREVKQSDQSAALDRYRPSISNIRRALKNRVETEINFIKDAADLVPSTWDHPTWYATFLLRPLLTSDDGEQRLADYFTLVYFAEYTGNEVTATSAWDEDPDLTVKKLYIDNCCSGLCVRYPIEKHDWRVAFGDTFYTAYAEHMRLEYLILDDVKKARFDPNVTDNLIRANYSTADPVPQWQRAVGWDLRDKKTKNKKAMSQNIQTEIIVPVYCLASGSVEKSKNEVLGVVNFEWDEPMSPQRRHNLAREIVEHIQKENVFAITYFTCEVLYNITLPEDDG